MSPTLAEVLLGTIESGALAGALDPASSSGLDPAVVGDAVLELAPVLLDITIPDIVTRAWQKVKALREFADPTLHPPEEVNVVALAQHVVHTEHHPAIEVRLGETLVHTIVIDVFAELQLDGFQVTVRDGKIWEARTGDLIARGRVEIAGAVLAQRESQRIELPGKIVLEQGLEIG